MSFMSARSLAVARPAAAQSPPIKPGLWEVGSEREGVDGQERARAAERMKNMPPESRAKLDAMNLACDDECEMARRQLRRPEADRAQTLNGNGPGSHIETTEVK